MKQRLIVTLVILVGAVSLALLVPSAIKAQRPARSQYNLAYWQVDENPFPVITAVDPAAPADQQAALIGDPVYPCHDGQPKGYGSLSQPFDVPIAPTGKQVYLVFNYHIFTQDNNYYLSDDLDRFDVLFNGVVVFKDMNHSDSRPATCDQTYNLGRQTGLIVIVGNPWIALSPGNHVNATFRLRNTYDYNYNTYVYVDNVHFEFR